jgi:hypothetical protein
VSRLIAAVVIHDTYMMQFSGLAFSSCCSAGLQKKKVLFAIKMVFFAESAILHQLKSTPQLAVPASLLGSYRRPIAIRALTMFIGLRANFLSKHDKT